MVVLSACLTNKTGKPIMSRQFVEISRVRIEGLLAAFPKLLNTTQQHTFVETDSVRYVFQSMEDVYLLLVTNKSSNIMEDLETLRLLARLVAEFCPTLDDEGVKECAFDLMFAFDEVLAMGHRETLSLQQIKTALEMESHEEKLHNAIRQGKINEAKEEAKRKEKALDASRGMRNAMGIQGMGGGGGGMGGGMDQPSRNFEAEIRASSPPPPTRKAPPKGKGMQLGSKSKGGQDLLKALEAEDELFGMSQSPSQSSAPARKASVQNPSSESILLKMEEKLAVRMTKDGSVDSVEVKGELKMLIQDPEATYARVQLENSSDKAFQFKTHPNINRGLWAEEAVLSHKDQSKSFPVGNELGILKWRATSSSLTLPISVSCWPSASGSESQVNIEYESESSLQINDLRVSVPCGGGGKVLEASEGQARYLAKSETVEWRVEMVDDSNRNGSLEFTASETDTDSFFPISVGFSANSTICDIQLVKVTDARNGSNLSFNVTASLEVEEYEIE